AETPEAEETTEAEVTEAEEATETETAEAEASEAEATPETAETQESRLIVLGDSDFFTNGLFGQVLNGDMFINSVNWLSQENEQLLSIRPREPNDRTLPITPQQARILIATIAIFPVMGLAASGVIWWSRR
ncbi:MAG: ABC transporter, partial [Cyanobacteriota bacterium]|nr:ABC transporter [Cyanobacteriota bacterium]